MLTHRSGVVLFCVLKSRFSAKESGFFTFAEVGMLACWRYVVQALHNFRSS